MKTYGQYKIDDSIRIDENWQIQNSLNMYIGQTLAALLNRSGEIIGCNNTVGEDSIDWSKALVYDWTKKPDFPLIVSPLIKHFPLFKAADYFRDNFKAISYKTRYNKPVGFLLNDYQLNQMWKNNETLYSVSCDWEIQEVYLGYNDWQRVPRFYTINGIPNEYEEVAHTLHTRQYNLYNIYDWEPSLGENEGLKFRNFAPISQSFTYSKNTTCLPRVRVTAGNTEIIPLSANLQIESMYVIDRTYSPQSTNYALVFGRNVSEINSGNIIQIYSPNYIEYWDERSFYIGTVVTNLGDKLLVNFDGRTFLPAISHVKNINDFSNSGTHWPIYIPNCVNEYQKHIVNGYPYDDKTTIAIKQPKPFVYDFGPSQKFTEVIGDVKYREFTTILEDDLLNFRDVLNLVKGSVYCSKNITENMNNLMSGKMIIQEDMAASGPYSPTDMTDLYDYTMSKNNSTVYNDPVTDSPSQIFHYHIYGQYIGGETYNGTQLPNDGSMTRSQTWLKGFTRGTILNYPSREALGKGLVKKVKLFMAVYPSDYYIGYNNPTAWYNAANQIVSQTGQPLNWGNDWFPEEYKLGLPEYFPTELQWNRNDNAGSMYRNLWSIQHSDGKYTSGRKIKEVWSSKDNPILQSDLDISDLTFNEPLWQPEIVDSSNYLYTAWTKTGYQPDRVIGYGYPEINIFYGCDWFITVEWNFSDNLDINLK